MGAAIGGHGSDWRTLYRVVTLDWGGIKTSPANPVSSIAPMSSRIRLRQNGSVGYDLACRFTVERTIRK